MQTQADIDTEILSHTQTNSIQSLEAVSVVFQAPGATPTLPGLYSSLYHPQRGEWGAEVCARVNQR